MTLAGDARPDGLSLYLSGIPGGEEVTSFSLDVSELVQDGQPKAVLRLDATDGLSRLLGEWYANKTFDSVKIAQTLRGNVKTQWQLNGAKIAKVSWELSSGNLSAVVVEFVFNSLETSETQLDFLGKPTKSAVSNIDVRASV